MLTQSSAAAADYRRDLGDGLVLRWSTREDTANIAQLCSMVFRNKEEDPPNEWMKQIVHELMSDQHPIMGSNDYGLIEDTRKEGRPVVACVCLQRLEWDYDGIAFTIGRPEIVAADPNYRNRGLIRELFAMVHARSEAEGHLAQAITGISYFYRQFGYEYALDLGGKRVVQFAAIPKAKEGEQEPFVLREATVEDIPHMLECYNSLRPTSLVWTNEPASYEHFRFASWNKRREADKPFPCQAIVHAESGQVQGYVSLSEKRWWRGMDVWGLNFAPGTNVHALKHSLLRALQSYGQQMKTDKPDTEAVSEIHFHLGGQHPFYDALGGMAPQFEPPYAWYVRVPHLPAFLKHITPVLEKRLANSPLIGHTGELKIDFFRGGLRMVFEKGQITTIEPWRVPTYEGNAHAGIPALVFLKLIFGYRSLSQIQESFPDVWANDEGKLLLNTLFPAQYSFVSPMF